MEKTHYMKLNEKPFENIASGNKTIELRLLDEKRSKISVGDYIEFTHSKCASKKIIVRVIGLHAFNSFNELYKSLPLNKCGYTEKDIHKASSSDMDLYYPKDLQEKYKALGIEFELCESKK